MNNKTLNPFNELLELKNKLKLSSDLIFKDYLSKIYTNLLQREEVFIHSKSIKVPKHSLEFKHKDSFLSSIKNESLINYPMQQKAKIIDKGISLKSFLEYMDIQEFIGERIYKYLNKSKNYKLNKNDFCTELNNLYYGDIKNLIKFTFFLSDFNDDGFIFKSDMKLLLAYIPSATEFSQKLKIKHINKIINIFFEQNIEKSKECEEKEITYEIYLKYVEEYINNDNKINLVINSELLNDFNYNVPFFYFISILSYLFKNCPFNVKNVDYFIYSKTKKKLQVYRNNDRYLSQKKLFSTSKKDLNYSCLNNLDNSSSKLNSTIIRKCSVPKNKFIIDASLSKIEKKNLFKTKKSSSQININNDSKYLTLRTKKIKNIKHDFIISKNIEKNNEKKSNLFNKSSLNLKKNSSSNIDENSTKNSSPIINNYRQSPNINVKSTSQFFFNSSNSNETNGSSKNNSSNNLTKLNSKFKMLSKEKEKMIPLSVGAKIKDEKNDIEEPAELVLCEYSSDEDSNNKNNSKNDENKEVFSDEVFLYKLDDNENINKLNKYYAMLSGKEILFFSSELKNELCDLWFIYNSYISTNKEKINGTNYYTITISFNNNRINKLYFINEKPCQDFSKRIKKSIKSLDFEEQYELLDKVGHGHFGKVYKCRNKLSGQIYAVKIINKKEVNIRDLELITQEKNYLKLIKHSNIISLKDYFEDKKNIYFVTEYYSGGDLLSLLEKKQKENTQISEKLAAKIIRKIAEGIKYLNFFGIIHRDIKPENIMFADKKDIKSLKIIDLGVCHTLTYGELAEAPIGTNGYIAPEIYLHHNYSFKVDIWSLGVILYLIITGGILPFDDENMDNQIIGKKVLYLQQEYPEKYFGNKSKGLISLLDKMLEKNDMKRININELYKDNWFENLKK